MEFKEYARYDAVGLAELIATKQVTSWEVVQAAISQIQKYNPQINAVVDELFDTAKAQCVKLQPGPLAGVPFLIKDLGIERAGTKTSQSSRFFAEDRATRDSELMKRFDRMGLITVGKTNLPELGILAFTESEFRGACRNPWNLNLTPGGSSGGSAAAVASRMVPAAHADDGGGSIRIPASACGLVGLKPSRGRTPIGPGKLESWGGFVSPHVVTRTVRDCAAFLDGVHGHEPGSPYMPPAPTQSFSSVLTKTPRKLKIAFTTESIFTDANHPECQRAVTEAAEVCRGLGHELVETLPIFSKADLRNAYFVVVASSIAQDLEAASKRLNKTLRAKDFEATTWFLYKLGCELRATDLSAATFQMRKASQILATFFGEFDLFLTSTNGTPPCKIGELQPSFAERLALQAVSTLPNRKIMMSIIAQLSSEMLANAPNTQVFNMSGNPAISLPVSASSENIPIGVQFAANYGNEETLLEIAQQLEIATNWDQRAPNF